jgi:MFS family permease
MQQQTDDHDQGRVSFGVAGKVVVLMGLTIPSYGMFALTPVLPTIAAAFPDEPNAGLLTRMMVSALGVVVALASPVIGAVADRVGARRVLLASLMIYAIAGCAPFFLDDLRSIVASRFIFGFGVAAFGAVIMTMLVANSSGAARNRWLGYMTTVSAVAGVVMYPLAGFVGGFGWRWTFLTYAVGVVILLLSLVGFPADPSRAAATKKAIKASQPTRFTLGTPIGHIAFALLAGAALMSPLVYVPFRARELGVTDSNVIGALLMTGAAASIISAAAYGWIRSRLSIGETFVLGFAVLASGAAVLGAAQSLPLLFVGKALIGIGLSVTSPNLFALAAVAGPDAYRARTIGFTKSGIYGGPIIAQLILEPVLKHTSFAFAFGVISLGCMALALANGWQAFSRRRALA